MIPAGFEPAPPERPGPYPGALDQLGQSTQSLLVFAPRELYRVNGTIEVALFSSTTKQFQLSTKLSMVAIQT